MRTAQYVGIPDGPADAAVEAGVVALKSRSIPASDAVALSLQALEWLLAQGCTQILFKYCSTFDSTDDGNIGPVTEALAAAMNARQIIVCPVFPATGRTLIHGHLFVGGALLSESGMQNHPLTPMTDPDIRRVLARQSKGAVGHVPWSEVTQGADAIGARLTWESQAGRDLIVVDALTDGDLMAIGAAAADLRLITGGSGIAMGLPANFRAKGLIGDAATSWRGAAGKAAALCGSCSVMTQKQVAAHKAGHPTYEIDVDAVIAGALAPAAAADWALAQSGVPLICSSADPDQVRAIQARHGREASAAALEGFFAELARLLVAGGVTRLISAGGETSGAVVEGLGLSQLDIGPEIDPGVPAMQEGDLAVALKSGNFGAEDFFVKAAAALAPGA
jgi:uncharacterized protein YgbK (DUF1537 family)